jgi:hypothetical protein
MDITQISECELLALVTAVTQKFACTLDTDSLAFWGDVFTALGTNLTMLSNQRLRLKTTEEAAQAKQNAPQNT